MLAILEFIDVSGNPKIRIDLPLLRLGDILQLDFCMERDYNGRHEVLDVNGSFKVGGVLHQYTTNGYRPVFQIASIGVAPFWKAVKKVPPRPLIAAISDPTVIS